MSHDRKPGRVRVVQAAGRAPKRRRGDGAARAKKNARAGRPGRGQAVLIALFLLASIGAGVGIELLLPS